MTVEQARKWLIKWTLIITGAQMLFLILAPAFGFPLDYPRNLDLLQIIVPVFFGYLGAAAHFIFRTPTPTVSAVNDLLGMMLKGPVFIYIAVVVAAIIGFGYSNRPGAAIGSGMSVEALSTSLTIALSLLAVSTGVISSYLFAVNDAQKIPPPTPPVAQPATPGNQPVVPPPVTQ